MCAYLTQMLKLSYALQYHGKLRRIDGTRERENGILKSWVYIRTRVDPVLRIQPISGKGHPNAGNERRGGDEKEN